MFTFWTQALEPHTQSLGIELARHTPHWIVRRIATVCGAFETSKIDGKLV